MFLMPWMEGSKFRKNVITRVPCWVRFADVPHSFWTRKGLTSIAKTVGKPLQLDVATAKLDPMKYARIQIDLEYGAPRPDYTWVQILNCDGEEEKLKIEIEYPQLPYSCSLCRAFGHSLSRCTNNPEA